MRGMMYRRCRICTKVVNSQFEAAVPVIKGRRALPPAPQADIHPTVDEMTRDDTCNVTDVVYGYRIHWTNRTSIVETEMAAAVKEGMSQTTNWKLIGNAG